MQQNITVIQLGQIPYKEAWNYQNSLLQENVAVKQAHGSNTQHFLLLCEHPPVYTLGKNGKIEHLLINQDERKQKQVDFFYTNRGGDITFHGPGQLIAYPILDLEKVETDIGKYLRSLEEIVIQLLANFDIKAGRSPKETGVWLDSQLPKKVRKICAIGVKLSRWVSMHGLALNVNTKLRYFDDIIPCGIKNKTVTSIQKELQKEVDINRIETLFIEKFCTHFNFVAHFKSSIT